MIRRAIFVISCLVCATIARADSTAVWEGRVRAGGILIDETGDQSVMQETYNLYEGFSLSSLYLKGHTNPRTHLLLDLTDINLGDRRGRLDFRRVGSLHLESRYSENRFVFDPAGAVDARRRNSQSTLKRRRAPAMGSAGPSRMTASDRRMRSTRGANAPATWPPPTSSFPTCSCRALRTFCVERPAGANCRTAGWGLIC
jgi:hypothetical protein